MLRNASLQLAKALSTTMPEPQPQPPSSGKVSCGSHAVPRALVAESQVWTVDWKWQEPRSLPRMNPLVCEAGRAKRNSHRMQRTLTTLSLSTTGQGHTGRPQRSIPRPAVIRSLGQSSRTALTILGTPASREISLNQSEETGSIVPGPQLGKSRPEQGSAQELMKHQPQEHRSRATSQAPAP